MDDDEDIEPSSYAGFLVGHARAWREEQPEALRAAAAAGDGRLYSGNEVRFHPVFQAGGDVIETKEFWLAPYRSNPVVLADHDPNHIIGRGTAEIVKGDGRAQLHGTATWDLNESNPLAMLVAGQHQRGLRSAVSIGFVPAKGSGPRTKLAADHPFYMDPEKTSEWRSGWFMRHPALYEWSSVSIPKDRGALQLQRQVQAWALEAEDPDERFRRIVCDELSAATKRPWGCGGLSVREPGVEGLPTATRPRRSDPLTPGWTEPIVGSRPTTSTGWATGTLGVPRSTVRRKLVEHGIL